MDLISLTMSFSLPLLYSIDRAFSDLGLNIFLALLVQY